MPHLYVIQNAHVYFSSLLTAEPEPWPSEQDVHITSTEQDNGEASFGLSGLNTERTCQAVHSPPPVGPQQQHYIDRFVIIPTRTVLGLAARRWTVCGSFEENNCNINSNSSKLTLCKLFESLHCCFCLHNSMFIPTIKHHTSPDILYCVHSTMYISGQPSIV